MKVGYWVLLAVGLWSLPIIAPGTAVADTLHGRRVPVGYVVAHSDWGHGHIVAPVRPSRFGHEVRLPRGTWVDCAGNCAEELRIQTIDFWEAQGNGRDALKGHRLLGLKWQFYY